MSIIHCFALVLSKAMLERTPHAVVGIIVFLLLPNKKNLKLLMLSSLNVADLSLY